MFPVLPPSLVTGYVSGRLLNSPAVSLQAALMVSLIWKYYSVPVAVVPSKWITPLDRLVAFPTRVAGKSFLGTRAEEYRRASVDVWGTRGRNPSSRIR